MKIRKENIIFKENVLNDKNESKKKKKGKVRWGSGEGSGLWDRIEKKNQVVRSGARLVV